MMCTMRGHDTQQAGLFSYLSPEERVPEIHTLRPFGSTWARP